MEKCDNIVEECLNAMLALSPSLSSIYKPSPSASSKGPRGDTSLMALSDVWCPGTTTVVSQNVSLHVYSCLLF